jgi:hypothetical protein
MVNFFCLIQSGFSQKAISIEKVIIKYEHARNYLNQPDAYGIEEIIQFSKSLNDRDLYYLTQYLRINEKIDNINPPSIDTLFIKPRNVQVIKGELFDELMKTLSNSENNFTQQFMRPYLNKLKAKDIIAVIKQPHFKSLYSESRIENSRKERSRAIKEIKSYFQLDSFLIKELENTQFRFYVPEALHQMTICFIMANDTIAYKSDFLGHPLRQPFILMNRKGSYTKKATTNLNINLNLMKILPKGSLLKEKMDFNSISEDYIKWYLKRYCNYAVKLSK